MSHARLFSVKTPPPLARLVLTRYVGRTHKLALVDLFVRLDQLRIDQDKLEASGKAQNKLPQAKDFVEGKATKNKGQVSPQPLSPGTQGIFKIKLGPQRGDQKNRKQDKGDKGYVDDITGTRPHGLQHRAPS